MHDESGEVHATRRDPARPDGPVDLQEVAGELLDQARGLAAGRAARTLTPGAGAPLKQTLLAIVAGRRLDEHVAPGPATLQVLVGEVVLRSDDTAVRLGQGHWAPIPTSAHELSAESDAVALLTVAVAPGDAG